jgi:hypothetical protein
MLPRGNYLSESKIMFPSKLRVALLSVVLAVGSSAASATTISFEGMIPAATFVNYMAGTTLNPTAGYALETSGGITAIAEAAALAAAPNYSANGTAFFAMASGATAQLSNTAGSLFSVNKIDLANLIYIGDPSRPADDIATATLVGTFGNGSTITQSYTFQNNNILTADDFSTIALTGFVDLASFAISASGTLSVDNIVINEVNEAAVPEPASLAILSLGLAGIAAARRRKKSA